MTDKKFINFIRKPIVAVVLAIIVGISAGAVVFFVSGFNAFEAYKIMATEIFTKPRNIAQVFVNAVPYIFTALAFCFSAKAGLFNIGIEGQFVIGALTGALIGYFIPMPPVIHPVVILIAAFFFGGILGSVSGFLKSKFGIHEVISTIMLNWIAHYFSNFIVNLPFVKVKGGIHTPKILDSAKINFFTTAWKRSEEGRNFIKENPFLGDIVRSDLGYGIIIAIITAVIVWFILKKTTGGFEIRAVGLNRDAAEFSGISVNKNIILTMFVSGGIAALGGAILVMTTTNSVSVLAVQEGYGWDGMSIALIANNSPLGILPAGLFFAALRKGGSLIQSALGTPTEIINIIIGVIVLSIAVANILNRYADFLAKKSQMTQDTDKKRGEENG